MGEEIVLSTSDWIIENYFLEYLLDPEVIEPYKMIIGMSDEVAQQKALSELDPIIRQKVLIELGDYTCMQRGEAIEKNARFGHGAIDI